MDQKMIPVIRVHKVNSDSKFGQFGAADGRINGPTSRMARYLLTASISFPFIILRTKCVWCWTVISVANLRTSTTKQILD